MDVPSYLQRPFEYVPHPSDDDLIRKDKYDERSRIRREQAHWLSVLDNEASIAFPDGGESYEVIMDVKYRLEEATRDA